MDAVKPKPKEDIFFTFTMAEVLEKQGRYEDALAIYKILYDLSRSDVEIKARMERLKKKAGRG